MKVLVTGGTGVVGLAAVAELVRLGQTVRVLSRNAEEDAQQLPEGVESWPAMTKGWSNGGIIVAPESEAIRSAKANRSAGSTISTAEVCARPA